MIAGDSETGVTIMRVVKELDAGPMFARVTVPIGPDATSVEIEARLAERRRRARSLDVVEQLAAGAAVETPQDDAAGDARAEDRRKTEGPIDWSLPARAHPQPCARPAALAARARRTVEGDALS